MFNKLINISLKVKMMVVHISLWNKFVKQTYHPRKHQEKLLKNILESQINTYYAKDNYFTNITNYQDYKKQISIQSYEELRPYIEKQSLENKPFLNTYHPIFYAITSGTTNKPKLIPITKRTIKRYKKSQSLMAYSYYKHNKNIYSGKIMTIVSPIIEGETAGIKYGSMSGLIHNSMSKLACYKYIIPNEIFAIEDYEAKYYYICLFALNCEDISLIATANPSTILKISQTINDNYKQLIKDISTAELKNIFNIADKQFLFVKKYFIANTPRAVELNSIFSANKNPKLNIIWRKLIAISIWTQGSVSTMVSKIRNIVDGVSILELGYLASELRGSINIEPSTGKCVPTIYEVFFEFIPIEIYATNKEEYLLIDEVELGKQYYIVITTYDGLYRYFMNDIVVVDGFFNNTPTIKFVQKGNGTTNITGEKLYESQVIEAIKNLEKNFQISIDFFMVIANIDNICYELFVQTTFNDIEAIAKDFEYYLSQINIEFKSKRDSNRLQKTKVILLNKSAYENYKKYCINNGQREGQFKYVALQNKNSLTYDFYQDIVIH